MFLQSDSNPDFNLESFLQEFASCWEPTSKRIEGFPVGIQPSQRGWKEKSIKFLYWLINESHYSRNASLSEEAIRKYQKSKWPDTWLWGFALLSQVLKNG